MGKLFTSLYASWVPLDAVAYVPTKWSQMLFVQTKKKPYYFTQHKATWNRVQLDVNMKGDQRLGKELSYETPTS